SGGAVDAAISLLQPATALIVQVTVAEELAAVDEIVADVVDRPLHLPLCLGTIRPASPRDEVPVGGEAKELLVHDELTAEEPKVLRDHRLHLSEEELPGHTAEEVEGLFQAGEERPHDLLRIEPEPEQSGVAEDHEKGIALPPWEAELREVDLGLVRRGSLEADDRLGGRPRPNSSNVHPELRIAAGISGRLDFLHQAYCRELREGSQALVNDLFVGIKLGGDWPTGAVLHRSLVQISVELTVADPAVEGVAADSELPGQGTLTHALLEVMSEQHPCLASDQGRLSEKVETPR